MWSSRSVVMKQEPQSGLKMGFFGPMKPLSSAEHSVEVLPDGRLCARIHHEPMKGVTAQMLRWWFENIDGFTRFNGRDFSGAPVPVYRLWHPYDHIQVSWARRKHDDSGRVTAGSIFRIEENLDGRLPVRAKVWISRFDDGACNFDLRLGGLISVGHLLHEYADTEDGCSFYTEMVLGSSMPLIGPLLNRFVRYRVGGEEFLRTWIAHNIEESGETEKFVPRLYEQANVDGAVAEAAQAIGRSPRAGLEPRAILSSRKCSRRASDMDRWRLELTGGLEPPTC